MDGVEYDPRKIVKSILLATLVIEGAGAFMLSLLFKHAGVDDFWFAGIFHSVSAFCNAGFSLFPDSLEGFSTNLPVLVIIMVLICLGGLGFIVIKDLLQVVSRRYRYLTYHSKVVLGMTALLILFGSITFFILERRGAFASFTTSQAVVNALFQAVTPRTAGFDTVPQTLLRQPSKVLTLLLMFIGAGPGSIAGGIKVSTVFVILVMLFRTPDGQGDIAVRKRRISSETIHRATIYFLKALLLLLSAAFLLSMIEGLHGKPFDAIVFEVVSAFGTVGLSLGLTDQLSVLGKVIIIITMFAGRVGLVALAFASGRVKEYDITYPEASVLLG
ncbi:MAG: potassium transporter TrkG [Termitinemataceae bacterium]